MSRLFRIYMAKGGRGSLRPRCGRPKLTLVSRFVAMQIRCYEKLTLFFIFGPIALKRIEHGVSILDSMFYLFPSDRTKNEKVLFFCNTAFSSQQNLKRGSTSAARNSALKTILPLYEHFEIREFLGLSWQY